MLYAQFQIPRNNPGGCCSRAYSEVVVVMRVVDLVVVVCPIMSHDSLVKARSSEVIYMTACLDQGLDHAEARGGGLSGGSIVGMGQDKRLKGGHGGWIHV